MVTIHIKLIFLNALGIVQTHNTKKNLNALQVLQTLIHLEKIILKVLYNPQCKGCTIRNDNIF